jgi:hypothetical protein
MKVPDVLPIPFHDTLRVMDSTKMQTYLTCPRKYFFEYILGYRPEDKNHNLVFGSAWHKAKDILFSNGYSVESVDAGVEAFLKEYRQSFSEETDMDFHPKSPGNAEVALYEYVKQYAPNDHFKVLHTEVGVVVPVGPDRVLYGKMDAINHDEARGYFSLETKTAGAHWSYWEDQWLQKFQISAYAHFLYCNYPPAEVYGIIIDGSIFKKSGNEHLRVSVPLTVEWLESWLWEVNCWFDDVERDFKRLEMCKESDDVMKAFCRNTESCVKYNRMCPLFEVCHARRNPIRDCDRLPMGLKIEHWDPRKEEVKKRIGV